MIEPWEWRYLDHGRKRHAVLRTGRGLARLAVCGVAPAWFADWLGTGSQREYERCDRLTPCNRCVHYLRPPHRRGGPVTHYQLVIVALPWLTANQRGSWRRSHRLIRDWRNLAAWSARSARIPRLSCARVIVELRFRTTRRRDPGNWSPTAKAIVDGLVDAGVFTDDDATKVIGPDLRVGAPSTGVPYGLVVVHLLPTTAGVPCGPG